MVKSILAPGSEGQSQESDPGAGLAETPAAAADKAEVVFTMLSDGAAVAEVLVERGLAAALAPSALMIECSSIHLALTRSHAARLRQAGVGHLDAPVSGGPSGAARASLAIMVERRFEPGGPARLGTNIKDR